MPTYPIVLTGLCVLASILGFMGIAWCRSEGEVWRARWGRRLFLGMLAGLGLISFAAALEPHRGLLYLGLPVSVLVIGMLWERPLKDRQMPARPEPMNLLAD